MPKKRRPKKNRKSRAAPATEAKKPKKRVVVVFKHTEDPTDEQRETLRQTLDRFHDVNVIGEIPGSLRVDVGPEEAEPLKHAVDGLEDWDLNDEGTAQMP